MRLGGRTIYFFDLPKGRTARKGGQRFPATTQRVTVNTSERINARIRCQAETNVHRFASAGPQEIGQRLAELDEEWDVERVRHHETEKGAIES
jgi:hypothetical protein